MEIVNIFQNYYLLEVKHLNNCKEEEKFSHILEDMFSNYFS